LLRSRYTLVTFVFQHQPHRLVITYNFDLTIRFYDFSAQLLDGLKPTPIKHNFPNALPALTIDLNPLLMDSFVSNRTSLTILDQTRIDSVSLAQESRELVVALHTGEVVVYRLSGPRMAGSFKEGLNEMLLLLEHIPTQPGDRFSPYFMLAPGAGPVEACAISDLGKLELLQFSVGYNRPQVSWL
jgi:syntaxin-binding protein 5